MSRFWIVLLAACSSAHHDAPTDGPDQQPDAVLRDAATPDVAVVTPDDCAGSPKVITVQDASPNLRTITMTSTARLVSFSVLSGQLADVDMLAGAPALIAVELARATHLRSIAGLAGAHLIGLTVNDARELVDLSPVRDTAFTDWLWISNTGATALSFPGTTALSNSLRISDNAALTSLAMPNLVNLGSGDDGSFVSDNPVLPTCDATAIRARVRLHAGSTFDIRGNLADRCSALRP